MKDKDKNILIMCVSQQILINTTVEHKLQNPQASNVLKLHSAHLQYLLVLTNTDSSLTRLYLISIVFSEKTIKFNWRELFQWNENTASAELTQLLACQYWQMSIFQYESVLIFQLLQL